MKAPSGTDRQQQRPFPWLCGACRKKEVRPAIVSHTANVKHHGRTHQVTVPELHVLQCEACRELVFQNSSHEQISRALRSKLGLLQPEEIRQKRLRYRITQEDLAKAIDAALATVSRWETGTVIQSRRADQAMRRFFASQGGPTAKKKQLVESLTAELAKFEEHVLEEICRRKSDLAGILSRVAKCCVTYPNALQAVSRYLDRLESPTSRRGDQPYARESTILIAECHVFHRKPPDRVTNYYRERGSTQHLEIGMPQSDPEPRFVFPEHPEYV